jgi:hypothetical protein
MATLSSKARRTARRGAGGDALVAVHEDPVAVQRLGRDVVGADDEGDGPGAGHDGGVRADGAFLEHDALEGPLAVFEELAGADVAGHEDRVVGHDAAGVGALAGEDAQEAVRQVVEVVEAVAEIGVGSLADAGAGVGLLLLHGGLGERPERMSSSSMRRQPERELANMR